MNENGFREFLKKTNMDNETIERYVSRIDDYTMFLEKEKLSVDAVKPVRLVEYTEYLVSTDSKSVFDFLQALRSYAQYIKNNDLLIEVTNIDEAFMAMDTLFSRVAEYHGESTRDEIFQDLTIPPLGVHPEKKPEFTKTILDRLEGKLGEDKTIELLSPCLHGRPPEDIEGDRKSLKDLGIDGFLEMKHQELVQWFEKHRDEGTLEYAQPVDDEVVEFVRNNKLLATGIREGSVIYECKIPYQIKKYLNVKDDKVKKYYLCYCPWIRGALKNGTGREISKNFCYCSAGFSKLYWDQVFEEPVKVEPVRTALSGALECRFAVHLTDNILNSYLRG